MHKGRVHDVTHCYNLGEKSAFLHTDEGLPAYYFGIGLLMSVSILE